MVLSILGLQQTHREHGAGGDERHAGGAVVHILITRQPVAANSQTLVTGLNEHCVDQPDLFVCGMKNQECSFCM